MAATFPKIIMIRPVEIEHGVAATGLHKGVSDAVYMDFDVGYINAFGKIEAEAAKIDSRYVHLRFTHTNRYWSQNNAEDRAVVAVSKLPEEDRTKSSCTLFEFQPTTTQYGPGFHLIHVQSGGCVFTTRDSANLAVSNDIPNIRSDVYAIVDWESVVELPLNVAFKGPNGKYLKPFDSDGKPFLQFSSDDPNEQGSGYRVTQWLASTRVLISSNGTGKYWRSSPDWILADTDSEHDVRVEGQFQAVRVDKNTIALKNAKNNLFCQILSDGGVTDCLIARSPTLIKAAKLEVQELVSERKIYNVNYRLDDARIYDETPFIAGESTLVNYSDQVASKEVSATYEEEKSFTFSRGFSTKAGVTTTIQAGVPFISNAGISVSFEISGNFDWDTTTTRKFSVSDRSTVPVPPRRSVLVKYVGTKGNCSIPYSYIQQDRLSTTGQLHNIPRNDGIFVSDSCYNFKFIIDKVVPL